MQEKIIYYSKVYFTISMYRNRKHIKNEGVLKTAVKGGLDEIKKDKYLINTIKNSQLNSKAQKQKCTVSIDKIEHIKQIGKTFI